MSLGLQPRNGRHVSRTGSDRTGSASFSFPIYHGADTLCKGSPPCAWLNCTMHEGYQNEISPHRTRKPTTGMSVANEDLSKEESGRGGPTFESRMLPSEQQRESASASSGSASMESKISGSILSQYSASRCFNNTFCGGVRTQEKSTDC